MDLNSINLACESLQTAHPSGLHTVVFSVVVTLPEEHSVEGWSIWQTTTRLLGATLLVLKEAEVKHKL